MQDFSRDERCRIKVQDSVGDIAGLAHAAQRMECARAFRGTPAASSAS
jgi:hypothetical protein